jgi:hypothetical protein
MNTLTIVDRCYCWTRGTHTVTASATGAMDTLTLADRCYRWTHDTRTIATVGHVAHTRLLLAPTAVTGTDISGTLLLPPTIATCHMTSDDRCYCWARDMHAVATDPTVAMGVLSLVARRHWHPQ